jgi:hypothetical protein
MKFSGSSHDEANFQHDSRPRNCQKPKRKIDTDISGWTKVQERCEKPRSCHLRDHIQAITPALQVHYFLTKGVHLNQPSFTAFISGPQARNTNHGDGKSSGDSHGYTSQHDPPPHTTTLPCTQPSRAQNTDCLPFAMISDSQTKTTMLRWLPAMQWQL